jgi:hypothetical protein
MPRTRCAWPVQIIMVFLLLVIVFIMLFPKSKETFQLNTGVSSIGMLRAKVDDNTDFLSKMRAFDSDMVANQSILSDQYNLLLAKRCYQFDVSKTELEGRMNQLKAAKIPVRSTEFIYYPKRTSNPTIASETVKLLTMIKKQIGGMPMQGPVFVMVSQAPYFRNDKCGMMPVQFYADDYSMKPLNKSVEDFDKCKGEEEPHIKIKLWAIFPAYHETSMALRIIPQHAAGSDNNTAKYLEKLVMDVMNQFETVKKYCFMECADDAGMVCGCYTSETGPKSLCMAPSNRPTTDAEKNTAVKSHFVMMYTVNTKNQTVVEEEIFEATRRRR